MKKTIVTCDVCKKEKKCEQLILNFNSTFYRSVVFDVCRDCCEKANLFKGEPHFQYESPKTTAEQLFDLIEEIAKNSIQE